MSHIVAGFDFVAQNRNKTLESSIVTSVLVSELSPWVYRTFALMFGAVWGSFFNVAIYRWPRHMSVVRPPSHCPQCKAPVRKLHNLPIIGWFLLRGKTGCCGKPLSPRYALIELMSAVVCVVLVERIVVAHPDAVVVERVVEALLYFAFFGGLIIATFVDLEWMEIPDEVSLTGTALGLVSVGLRTEPGAADAALGAGMGFLVIQLFFVWTYEHVTGRRGMGEGDSKLLMMIGAFLGWRATLFSLVVGAMQGLVTAGVFLFIGKEIAPEPPYHERAEADPWYKELPCPSCQNPVSMADLFEQEELREAKEVKESGPRGLAKLKMPYGPFLALGAMEYYFFGEAAIEAYFRLLRF